MKRVNKGVYGYVDYRKKKQLFLTLAEFLAVSLIFLTGFLVCKTKYNICTVIAIVLVLPAARAFVAFLMFAGLKTGDKEKYNELAGNTAGFPLLSDCIMTCGEKNIYVIFAVVTDAVIYCYSRDTSFDGNFFEKYVSEFIQSCKDTVSVRLFTDYEQFKKKVFTLSPLDGTDKTQGGVPSEKKEKMERIKNDFLILVI